MSKDYRKPTGRGGNGKKSYKDSKPKKGTGKKLDTEETVERDSNNRPSKFTDAMNDPDMYFDLNDELTKQLMNFSFDQFQGVPFNLGKNTGNKPYTAEISSLMRIELNPSPGFLKSGEEVSCGINLQGLRNFITLSSNNAKTTQYAPQDVTMLMLALGEVISMISWGTRTFGLYGHINIRNRSLPEKLLAINKINPTDFISKIAQYRADFNYLIKTANKIPFFGEIEYFKKCARLYNGFYQDSPDSAMAQYFMFTPCQTWIFDEAYSSAGSGLRTDSRIVEATDGAGILFSTFLTVLKDQIDKLLNSATLNYVYSDIIRLCDSKGYSRVGFQEVPDDYLIQPVYEPEAIHWMHNVRFVGGPRATAQQHAISGYTFTNENDVVPNASKNWVEYRPQFRLTSGINRDYSLVDFPYANPTVENKIEATRLVALVDAVYDSQSQYYYTKTAAISDHYATRFLLTAGDGVYYGAGDNAIDYTNINKLYMHMIDQLSKYDHGPLFYVTDETDPSDTLLSIIGDVNYYTVLDLQLMERIHDASYIKLFRF